MGQLNINQSKKINAKADRAWDIIGPNFVNVSTWARGVEKSWANESVAKGFADAPAAGRYCDVAGFGKMDEKILHYNADKREITWSADGAKLPGFLNNLQNAVNVVDNNDGTSTISSNISADLNGILGFLMSSVVKRNFNKVINGFLIDWKTYAESGKISEIKLKELAKLA